MHLALAAVLGAPPDRWLSAFAIAVFVVVVGGWFARDAGHKMRRRHDRGAEGEVRGLRRRAGALLAVGPVVGLLVWLDASAEVWVAVLGAVGFAAFGAIVERRRDAERTVLVAIAVASAVAVFAGVRFAPTGVGLLDVVLGFGFVFAVTFAFDGLGNADALVPGLAGLSGFALLALGGFAEQYALGNVAAGTVGACVGFLAYNAPPASLFAGRAGRLSMGFVLGVLACDVQVVPGAPAPLLLALMVVAVPLLDGAIVIFDRAQRHRPLSADRRDHLVNRIVASGASRSEAVGVLLLVQGAVVVLAVLAGRDVISLWLAVPIAALIVGALGGYAWRAVLETAEPVGFSRHALWVVGGLVAIAALGVVPLVLEVPDVTDTMQSGRMAAQRGLSAARAGDAARAELEFRRAAGAFHEASDRLDSVRFEAARVVPGIAPNLRAARALADIGYDLSHNGEVVTASVVPESLAVVDGKLPLDELKRITPVLERGSDTLDRSLARLRAVAREPYLLDAMRDAVDTVQTELTRAAREAHNTARAAHLAPAIFGGKGEERRYLLVVQNPAEVRGTGGLIGSYGILTARDGKIDMGGLARTETWNRAMAAVGSPDYLAPADYVSRYGQFEPGLNLQNVNLSPDFPTVGTVLASLTPAAGLGDVDGVIAVDPDGLAAILELTGPVSVSDWPTQITADNVVSVTLRDAYAAFARTPERAEFLGDVAQVVVDEATTGRLGEPAKVAQVLGRAAHEGHLVLSFTRRKEQRLARALDVDGAMVDGGDVLHVTNANFSGNKLDYYLKRDFDYRLELRPDDEGRGADATGDVTVRLANTAPTTGLPRTVAGPYVGAPPGRFREGENVSYVSVYTPLDLTTANLDGADVPIARAEELGTHVYSTVVDLDAQKSRTLELGLDGRVRMGKDGWYVLDLGRQPLVNRDRVRVSISVPEGYRISDGRDLQKVYSRRATGILDVERPRTVRVRIERDPSSLWDRLDAGN